MKRPMDDGGFPPDILHDVYLATVGPVRRIDVFTQEPKRGPDTLPIGNSDSRLKLSIGLAELLFCKQSGRSVVAGDSISSGESFPERLNDQRARFNLGIRRPIGISLEFVVTPTV